MTQSKETEGSRQGDLIAKPPTLIEQLTAGESPFLLPDDLARVVHLRRDSYDVRIDRGTAWGNPFPLANFGGDRKACLLAYAKFMLAALWRTPMDNEKMHADIDLLRGKVLGCWCAPKACHGHVLAALSTMQDETDREAWLEGLVEFAQEPQP